MLLLLLAAACGGEREAEGVISREKFVAASVALRSARFPHPESAVTPEDSAKARADSAAIRAEVLRRQGVTPRQLRAFVAAHRSETEELAEVWDEITNRLARADSVARADSARRDSLAQAPGASVPTQQPPPAPGTALPPPPSMVPDAGPPPSGLPESRPRERKPR